MCTIHTCLKVQAVFISHREVYTHMDYSYIIIRVKHSCHEYQTSTIFILSYQSIERSLYTVVKPAVQIPYKPCRYRKYIRDNIPMHAIFCRFCLFFHTVLSRSYFTPRTPDKDQKIEQLFYLYFFKSYNTETSMSSVAWTFVHAIHKRSRKVPHAKSGDFWFPWTDFHYSTTIL